MKSILALAIILFCFLNNLLAQEKFSYEQNGLNPKYIVQVFEGTTQKQLFDKSINWIKETYKNPDKVIKTTIDSSMVRLEGSIEHYIPVMLVSPNGDLTTYTIEISFRNGRYKFEPINLSAFGNGDWIEIDLDTAAFANYTKYAFYKKNGDIKPSFKDYPALIENLFNNLNLSLLNYLKDSQTKKEEEIW